MPWSITTITAGYFSPPPPTGTTAPKHQMPSPYNKFEKRLRSRVKTTCQGIFGAISGVQIYKFSKNESKSMRKPGLRKIKIIDFELKPWLLGNFKGGYNRSVPTSGRASVGSEHCSVVRLRRYTIFPKNRQDDCHIWYTHNSGKNRLRTVDNSRTVDISIFCLKFHSENITLTCRTKTRSFITTNTK